MTLETLDTARELRRRKRHRIVHEAALILAAIILGSPIAWEAGAAFANWTADRIIEEVSR